LALDLLARDRMQDFQELADGAFTDLLRKHGRPIDLKAALRQSIKDAGDIYSRRYARFREAASCRELERWAIVRALRAADPLTTFQSARRAVARTARARLGDHLSGT
jgi:hypothetical protein